MSTTTVEPHDYSAIAEAFDALAEAHPETPRPARGYHRQITALTRASVRPGATVLEIGCGAGDLLAALATSRGVGIDVSGKMVELARRRHPGLVFEQVAGEDFELGETFDYIVLSDLVPYVDDLVELF